MTHLHKKQALLNCLKRLAKEFNVPIPQFTIPDDWPRAKYCGGVFHEYPPWIFLNPYYYNNNIGEALRIVRHEFAHYLIYHHDLDIKHLEKTCNSFEKNIHALKIKPRFQTTLDFCFPNKDRKSEAEK